MKTEKELAQGLLEMRKHDGALWFVLKRTLRSDAIMLLCGGVLLGIAGATGPESAYPQDVNVRLRFAAFGGFLLGGCLLALSMTSVGRKMWLFSKKTTDWHKVEQIASGPENVNQTPERTADKPPPLP